MEKITKKPTLLSVLFGINEGINNEYDDVILAPEQIEAQNRANEMGKNTEQPIVTEGNKSSKSGGFSAGLKSDTLGKMKDIADGKTTVKNQVKENKPGIEKEI